MKPIVLALAGIVFTTSAAFAVENGSCTVAESLVHADYPLRHAAAAIAKKQFVIVVLGSASSTLPGTSGAQKAYPARLQAALTSALKTVGVRVVVYAKARQTAADMARQLGRIMAQDKPALVIWQTGTVDAIRGVDPDAFRATLDETVKTIRSGKADVVLMDMQYSPRTESIIAVDPYLDVMRFAALQHEIPLFGRMAIMKHWSELGTFDLYSLKKSMETAERVHACIGQLLADLVMQGVGLAHPEKAATDPAKAIDLDANEAENKNNRHGNRRQ